MNRFIRTYATSAATTPSQIRGHVRYAAGLTSQVLGSLLSRKMAASGAARKNDGIAEMRAAKGIGDKKVEQKIRMKKEHGKEGMLAMVGKSEGTFGWMVGCEGMKERGEWKKAAAHGKGI